MSNLSKRLFSLAEFNKLHHKQKLSIYQIAEEYGTYPNKVRRLAKKLGAEVRNKSEAQKVALTTGRQAHPTKGTIREEEVKIKISEGVADNWDNMSEKEKKRRAKLSKDQWDSKTDDERREFQRKAAVGIRKAAKFGSKLEKKITEWLIEEGYKITFHKQHIIGNERMHLDIVINDILTAIEIDGPSHFEPIWGEDKLKKSKATDDKKDGLLLGAGYSIIRIKQKKDLTKKLVRDIIYQLEDVISRIEKKKDCRRGTRRFVIGD